MEKGYNLFLYYLSGQWGDQNSEESLNSARMAIENIVTPVEMIDIITIFCFHRSQHRIEELQQKIEKIKGKQIILRHEKKEVEKLEKKLEKAQQLLAKEEINYSKSKDERELIRRRPRRREELSEEETEASGPEFNHL